MCVDGKVVLARPLAAEWSIMVCPVSITCVRRRENGPWNHWSDLRVADGNCVTALLPEASNFGRYSFRTGKVSLRQSGNGRDSLVAGWISSG